MKFQPTDPPRIFSVGRGKKITLKDCARLELGPEEQVTFATPSGTEYDVVRKSWGYYATPSLNRRLVDFGLQAALVKSGDRLYVLLVETGKEQEFHAYLDAQGMEVLQWLSQGLKKNSSPPRNGSHETENALASVCPMCGSASSSLVFRYDAPPPGETRFQSPGRDNYHREIWRCRLCRHFVNRHRMELEELYRGAYVASTYGAGGLLKPLERIVSLPPPQSDNYHRVKRIVGYFAQERLGNQTSRANRPRVLDVGSGLCVFLYQMKKEGWDCTALDPDPRAVEHARSHVGVKAVCGDFMELTGLGSHDLIAFNKVLEHVSDPVGMLSKCREHLGQGGVVYVEVPDGEAAACEGAEREEFFIEHVCAFSVTSLSLLASHAGFTARLIESVREPSGKYTLRAFLE